MENTIQIISTIKQDKTENEGRIAQCTTAYEGWGMRSYKQLGVRAYGLNQRYLLSRHLLYLREDASKHIWTQENNF